MEWVALFFLTGFGRGGNARRMGRPATTEILAFDFAEARMTRIEDRNPIHAPRTRMNGAPGKRIGRAFSPWGLGGPSTWGFAPGSYRARLRRFRATTKAEADSFVALRNDTQRGMTNKRTNNDNGPTLAGIEPRRRWGARNPIHAPRTRMNGAPGAEVEAGDLYWRLPCCGPEVRERRAPGRAKSTGRCGVFHWIEAGLGLRCKGPGPVAGRGGRRRAKTGSRSR
jgi:hypothetical protein